MTKFWTYFSKIVKFSANIFLLWIIKYWKIIPAIWSHWLQLSLKIIVQRSTSGRTCSDPQSPSLSHSSLSQMEWIHRKPWRRILFHYFLKIGRPQPLFVNFTFFAILQCRLQWDSNSDCINRRRARCPLDYHPGPIFIIL